MKQAAGFLIFRQINAKIEYLLLKASYGSHHWTPPKGHVDPGEDLYTTAKRETSEEAGYTDKDLEIFLNDDKFKYILNYQVNDKPKTVTYWLAKLINPNQEPRLSEEHTEFIWSTLEDAIKLSGFKDFEQMLRKIDSQILNLS